MKRMKKVWALVLALVMVLALGVTNAAAADDVMDFEVLYLGKNGGENDYKLAGGVFVLKENGTEKYISEPSDEYGLAKFTGVSEGTYTLELKTAPVGYEKAKCIDKTSPEQYEETSTVTVTKTTETAGGVTLDRIHAKFTLANGTGYQWNGGKGTEGVYTQPSFRSEYNMYVVEVPYIKTVALGGNAAPGSMVFEVETIDGQGNALTYAFAERSFKMETTGAGEFRGKLVIKGNGTNMKATFSEGGITIREKNTGADNWTYSKAQYTIEVDTNNWTKDGDVYVPTSKNIGHTVDDAGHALENVATRDLAFTNTYTRNVSFYYNNTTTTETKGSPKTFDAGIGVYAVSALLSVTGGAWLVGKKHK